MVETTYLHNHWEGFLELAICKGLENLTPTKYFHTVHAHSNHARETDLLAWKKSIESQLEELTKQLKKTPHHSDMGSCTFPPIPSHGVADCLEEKNDMKMDVVEQKEPDNEENLAGKERKSSPSARLNASLPMGNANEGEKLRLGNTRKSLFQEKVQVDDRVWQVPHNSPGTRAVNLIRNKRKKSAVQHVSRNTRHAAAMHKSNHPMLQLFGRLCDMYLPPSGWIPYLIDDDVFQLQGIVAHVGKMECDVMLTMQAIGVNAIEVYIALLYHSIIPNKKGIRPFGFICPGFVSPHPG